jgi:hypothetical protein
LDYFFIKPGSRSSTTRLKIKIEHWLYLMSSAFLGALVNFGFLDRGNIAVWFGAGHIYRPDFNANEPHILMAGRFQELVVV